MKYEVEFNNVIAELPKYNLSISDKIESIEAYNGSGAKFKDKCKKMYDFLASILTKDTVENIIGTFSDVDPNELNILYLKVVEAYNAPTEEYSTNKGIQKIEDLKEAVSIISDIVNANNSIND
jgi:hypothetical protein